MKMQGKALTRGSKILILTALISALACSGSSTPNNIPNASDQNTQNTKEKELKDKQAALDKENADITAKQKTTLDEEDQVAAARDKLEIQKADLEKLKEGMVVTANNTEQSQSELSRAMEIQNKVIQESKDPVERMAARLSLGESVPILVQIIGPSKDQLHGLENELAAMNVYPKFYSSLDESDANNLVGLFAIELGSLEKLKSFKDYARTDAPKMKVVVIPIEKVLVRTYIQLSYKESLPLTGTTFIKQFWIGDSPISDVSLDTNHVTDLSDVAHFVTYLKDCNTVTASCLKTLVTHNYFKSLSWIDGRSQDPLSFLEEQLGETSWLLGDQGYRGKFDLQHPKNSTAPLINEVSVVNSLWVVSDLTPYSELSEAYGSKEASYVEQIGTYGSYKSPLYYKSNTPVLTGNKNLDIPVITNQLHDYLCTVISCLPKR